MLTTTYYIEAELIDLIWQAMPANFGSLTVSGIQTGNNVSRISYRALYSYSYSATEELPKALSSAVMKAVEHAAEELEQPQGQGL